MGLIALSMALGVIVQIRTENWGLAWLMAAIGIVALVVLAVVWRRESHKTRQA